MNRFFAVLPAVMLAVPAAARAQGQFEGVVTMRMTAGSGDGRDMVYSVKGDRIRSDIEAGAAKMYMIRQGDKNDVVIPAQKMYMEQVISAGMVAGSNAQGKGAPAKVTRTGKKETIAGYECEHVIISQSDGKKDLDACLARGLGTFMAGGSPMGGRGRAAAADPMASLASVAGFPLKLQEVGGETFLLVTKIEKKPLDESLFTIPSDYKKMDMAGMMGRPPQL